MGVVHQNQAMPGVSLSSDQVIVLQATLFGEQRDAGKRIVPTGDMDYAAEVADDEVILGAPENPEVCESCT